jgi:hypothetical protein
MLSEDPLLLLALLHHRTINEPGRWITFDSANVVLAECFGPIDHVFNSRCAGRVRSGFRKLMPLRTL